MSKDDEKKSIPNKKESRLVNLESTSWVIIYGQIFCQFKRGSERESESEGSNVMGD